MSEPFLAEIRIVGFTFPPRGWAQCDGQILPIAQYQSLYSLMGTMYGGDGRTNFALPDLRGRAPLHVDGSHVQGQRSGQERVTLGVGEIPAHRHHFGSGDQATSTSPSGNAPASRPRRGARVWASTPGQAGVLGEGGHTVGNGQSHENMQPSLVLNCVIALQGLFPSRN